MKTQQIWHILALALLSVTVTGCIVAVGNSDNPKARAAGTTGQQLTDLKKARDANAISEEEYQAQRRKVLEAGNKR